MLIFEPGIRSTDSVWLCYICRSYLITFFLLLCFLSSALSGQSSYSPDSLLVLIKKSPPQKAGELEELLIEIMYTAPYDSAKSLSEKLLRVAPGINNNSLYIKTLIHSYRFHSYNDKIRMLNKALSLASDKGNAYLMSAAYEFKAVTFRDNSMTDSAMINALRAKDILEELGPEYKKGGVLQLIADLHYYAGQYDEAEKIYRMVLAENDEDKNSWRYITLNNNIGLIRIKQNRFAEAEQIFRHSLAVLNSRKMNYADSSGLPYLYRKMAEVALYQKKFAEAENHFILGEIFSIRFRQTAELPGLYIVKGSLCYEQGEADSALFYFKKAEQLDEQYPDFGNQVTLYHGLADTYGLLNDKAKANEYLHLLLAAKNREDSVRYRAKYMNTFAEYNYKHYIQEIEHYKNQQIFLVIIISGITLSLLITGYFYIKMIRANKKLVEKNIEAVEGPVHHELSDADFSDEDTKSTGEIDEARLEKNIADLERLMTQDKLYLDKDISLGKAADILGTNRTYLSKAINRVYNSNFNSYVNELRVREAIHLITSGELQHLKIDGIAEKCGFSNRVSFTKAFQKFTGVSPSFFIKNAKNIT